MIDYHLDRIQNALANQFDLTQVAPWIEKHLVLKGKPYRFEPGHEFQRVYLNDISQDKVVRKCSQIGLSQTAIAECCALACIIDGSTSIYTLPTSTFADAFVTTRVDPLIEESPILHDNLHFDVDNKSMKMIGRSLIIFKGTVGARQAISQPADFLFRDEYDFSDISVLTSYESRLTHSPYRFSRDFSTPTRKGFGISEKFENSRRHWNWCKCEFCTEWFMPDYYNNVRIPGYDDDLRLITAKNMHLYQWQAAQLHCPKCGKVPSLLPEHREYIVENPLANYVASGYQITPFDAPLIISPADLVKASTKYKRVADFINFNLGLPSSEGTEALTEEDITNTFIPAAPQAPYACMGIDVGLTCHITIGWEDHTGQMFVLHRERCHFSKLEVRKLELQRIYRTLVCVIDSQPYADLVRRIQNHDPRTFAAIYAMAASTEAFVVVDEKADEDEGKLAKRMVKINHTKHFDELAGLFKEKMILIASQDDMKEFTEHCLDMIKVDSMDKYGEWRATWSKSVKGEDHWWHSLGYCKVACNMRGMVQASLVTGGVPLVSSFKVDKRVNV